MRIAGCVAALLLACSLVQAQAPAPASNPNAQAKELATRLGRERSAEGLETILRAQNVDLLNAYERGLQEAASRLFHEQRTPVPMPADIEALMVRYYGDPVIGGPLRVLCSSNIIHYQSRALFDLMFAEWRSRKVRPSSRAMYESVLQTDVAGVEPPLVEWLAAADPPVGEDKRRIVEFLGKRRYRPAVPVLAALQHKADPYAGTASAALLHIATPDAIDAVLERLAALRREPTAANSRATISSLASSLAALPASVPLPYARLRAVLPEDMREFAIPWLRERKDLAAVPDALALLGDTAAYPRSLEVLVATDSPDVWKRARAEVERLRQQGRLNDGQYRHASTLLDAKIADPEKHFAQKREQQQAAQLQDRRSALMKAIEPAMKLRASDPGRYVAGMRDYLAGLEKLAREYAKQPASVGARGDVASGYLDLGHFARFRMKRPNEALELYAASQRNGGPLGGFAVADTLQFDLRDSRRAVEEYRKLLAGLEAAQPMGGPDIGGQNQIARGWTKRWLAAQEQYLSTGKRFTGPIGGEDAAFAVMVLYSGGGGQEDPFELMQLRYLVNKQPGADGKRPAVNRKEVARILQGLPASGFVLMSTGVFLASMPDAHSILAFLDRHDPAGFATASYFGAIEMVGREARGDPRALQLFGLGDPGASPTPLLEAKSRFMRERRVTLQPKVETPPPYPRK